MKFAKRLDTSMYGGGMWESNPPVVVLARQHSFEDWQAHQHLSTPIKNIYYVIILLYFLQQGNLCIGKSYKLDLVVLVFLLYKDPFVFHTLCKFYIIKIFKK
jgi:hypothetical protein